MSLFKNQASHRAGSDASYYQQRQQSGNNGSSWGNLYANAKQKAGSLNPYMDGKLSTELAMSQGLSVLKEFMVSNTRVDTLNMFSDLSNVGPFEDKQSVPISIVLPAFITSELKTAFEIGFLIFLPFLVIDMVIASILMSLGMMMLSPMLISLPFKLLLFVLVDGWSMTVGSLSATFLVE